MPECPHCKKEINQLGYRAAMTEWGDYYNGGFRNSESGYNGDLEFTCPECCEVLFHDESEAAGFLSNPPVTKW